MATKAEEKGQATPPDAYTFNCVHNHEGFSVQFSRDAQGLCSTLYELGRAIRESILEDSRPESIGDFFRTMAAMADDVDKALAAKIASANFADELGVKNGN